MDRSAVEAIVEREIGPLMESLGLSRWQVTTACDLKDDETLGHVNRLVDYDKAHIQLNPYLFDDEPALLRTLRHELFHLVLAPMDLYSEAVEAAIDRESPAFAVVGRVWTHAVERAVANLERMHAGLAG